jgi:hypothetical protein
MPDTSPLALLIVRWSPTHRQNPPVATAPSRDKANWLFRRR